MVPAEPDISAESDIASLVGSLTTLLLSTQDVHDFLQEMSQLACAVVTPVASCGITTRYDSAPLTVASSDERARVLDQAQYEADDGPCLHALRTGAVVEIDNQANDERWPGYRRAALEQNVLWVLAHPLRVEGETIGVMNLYGFAPPNPLDGPQRHRVEIFVAQAATALRLASNHIDQQQLNLQLEAAIASRSVIDQAVGVLMAEQRGSAEMAFGLLRRQSQRTNSKLRQVATDVVTKVSGHLPTSPNPFVPGESG